MSNLVKPIELDKMHTTAEAYDVGNGNIALMFTDETHWAILVMNGCNIVGYDTDTLPLHAALIDLAAEAVSKYSKISENRYAHSQETDTNGGLCRNCLRKIN